ncbi:DNA cytosine methyltransferase [bacterium]|nr:DNA cytosine methyltransferase [bacterium]
MKYISVCSGIEAASQAWHPLGWTPPAFSEIEPFPSAVLAHHYPDVPNLGDMTQHAEWPDYAPDVIVGGTPCQAFSVAGLRKGLEDPRGNLTLVFLGILAQYRPRWVVWENVPGVLSDQTGAFGAFLGGLGQLGYGFAYRVLDAQYFGVAQRRRRVFVVGCLGDWRGAAAVLFEPACLRGDLAPSRETRKGSALDVAGSLGCRGVRSHTELDGHGAYIPELARSLNSHASRVDGESETFIPEIAHTLRGEGFDASEDGCGRGTPLVPVAFSCKDHGADAGDIAPTMRAMGHESSHANGGGQVAIAFERRMVRTTGRQPQEELHPCLRADLNTGDGAPCVAFAQNTRDELREMEVVGALAAEPGMKQTSYLRQGFQVRRITPTEAERLQGFPDGYTDIPWRGKDHAPDGPRYKALGNSMAVPVMRWIGERIAVIDTVQSSLK